MNHDPDTNEVIAPGDSSTILLGDPYEIRRWCQRLVCTEETLRKAVAHVGTDPTAVRAAIKKRGLEVGVRDSSRR